MIQGIVDKQNNFWLGHPDVCLFLDKIFVCYRKSFEHLSKANTSICVVSSFQNEINWSAPYEISLGYKFNCPRLCVCDKEMILVCDVIPSGDNFIVSENSKNTKIWFWKTKDGIHWEGPIRTNISGIVPSKIVTNFKGQYLLASHTKKYFLKNNNSSLSKETVNVDFNSMYSKEEISGRLIQNIWISDSINNNWNGPIKVADKNNYNFCEGSLFNINDKIIGCMMRENSRRGDPSFYSLSYDGGYTWSNPSKTRMFGCHRPVTNKLKSGYWLTTYRDQSNSVNKKFWAKNTIACLSEKDSWIPSNSFVHSIDLCLDHDRNKDHPDSGYTGWVQLDDNRIFIVNYITDKESKPYIKYYIITEDDF